MDKKITWDAVNKGVSIVLSNGNLTFLTPNSSNSVRATEGKVEGKWYWEVTFGALSNATVGIVDESISLNTGIATNSKARMYYSSSGEISYPRGSYGKSYTTGSVIGVKLDLDNDSLEFLLDGVSQGTIKDFKKDLTSAIYPCVSSWSSSGGNTSTTNFGDSLFKYEIPSGYKANGNLIKNKIFILHDGKYKEWEAAQNPIPHWEETSDYPTSVQFLEHGMDLAVLVRKTTKLNPFQMAIVDVSSEEVKVGKVFNKTIELNKYFDAKSIGVEIKR